MPSKSSPFPARLHVLMASKSEVGLVFRRGPSRRVAAFIWDRSKDIFRLSQWHEGRIYERASDLSPDGQHLLYFAADLKCWHTWTAISKMPSLESLDLYTAHGTYEGGGLFLSDASYKLHAIWAGRTRKKDSPLVRDDNSGPELEGTGDLPVYFAKLKRDGWQPLTGEEKVFDKLLPSGWKLRKRLRENYTAKSKRGRGCRWDEHELFNAQSGVSIDGSDWEWADWDRNSVVWATKGCIYRASIKNNRELLAPVMLHDFTPYTFEEREAPY